MKKIILIAVIAFTSILSFAKIITDHLAKPDEIEGYKIYMLCKPVDDYEKVGYVKIKAAWTGQPDEMIKQTLKKAQKDFPTGDAIVFQTADMSESLVIKFK